MPLRRSQFRRLSVRRSVPAIVLALLATACPASTPRPADLPGAIDPVTGGTLRVTMAGDVDALDPALAASPSAWFFLRAMHRGLLAFPNLPGEHGSDPVPDLASALPEVDQGGRRYMFTLKRGIRFSDGAPVEAADVVASLRRLVRDGRGIAPWLDVIDGAQGSGAIQGLRARGTDTVIIRLRRASPDLPWILAHPQAAIVPRATARPGRTPGSRIIGAGPYVLDEYRPQRSLSLVRSETWGDDRVRAAWVDRIDATIEGSAAKANDRVIADEADLVLDPGPPDVAPRAPGEARIVSVPSRCIRFLFLNRIVAPFTSTSVRGAVSLALDRRALADAAGGIPSVWLLPPVVTGAEQMPVPPQANVTAARRVLGGERSAELVVGTGRRDVAEARLIRTALAEAGITIRVSRVDPAVLYPTRYADPSARTAMGVATWCADWPGLAGRNVLGSTTDPARARSTAFNPIFAGPGRGALSSAIARAARAPAARASDAWAVAARVAQRDAGAIALYAPIERVVVGPRLRGLDGAPMFPRGDPTWLWLAEPA